MGAVVHRVPLRDHRYDLDAMLAAIAPRTKLAYICIPNNPTGTMNTRAEVDAWFERVPGHVTTVLDQAYLEYVDRPGVPGRDRGVRAAGASRDRAADVLEDLRARRAPGRLRRRARGGRPRARARRAARSTSPRGAGGGGREPRRTGAAGAGAPPGGERGGPRRAGARLRDQGSTRSRRSRTSSTSRSGTTPSRCSSTPAGGRDRPAAARLRRPGAIRVTVGTPEEVAFFSEALARITSRASVA